MPQFLTKALANTLTLLYTTPMDIDSLRQVVLNFSKELSDATEGKQTSFAFIKNTLPSSPLVHDGQTLQSMVAGGTVFRTCLVDKKNGELSLREITDLEQPPFDTKEHFFEFLLTQLKPYVEIVALNFAFPLTPIFENGKLDGILQYTTKEHVFAGLVGEKVGTLFEEYVLKKTGRKILVSVANDTICLLVSGVTKAPATELAAGIVGTGLNFAFFLNETTPVNLEAARFDKFPMTNDLKEVDSHSNKPGEHIFEKAVSGGYLYQHLNVQMKKAGLNHEEVPASVHISHLAREGEQPLGKMAADILTYSAKLISCAIAGFMEFNRNDMSFVMQGSLFWKGYNYLDVVKETVKELSPEYSARFIDLPDSDLLGAAKLVA